MLGDPATGVVRTCGVGVMVVGRARACWRFCSLIKVHARVTDSEFVKVRATPPDSGGVELGGHEGAGGQDGLAGLAGEGSVGDIDLLGDLIGDDGDSGDGNVKTDHSKSSKPTSSTAFFTIYYIAEAICYASSTL